MNYDEAWTGYQANKAAFEAAGIPWNKKDSPHRLLLKAKWFLRQLPVNEIISRTIRLHTPQLVANISANNSLLKRLMRK